MSSINLNEVELRIAVAALQILERELADVLDRFGDDEPPVGEPSVSRQETRDAHDFVAELADRLSTGRSRTVNDREIDVTARCVGRYVALLASSISQLDLEDEGYLIDIEQRGRQTELAHSSTLLTRLTLH